MYSVKMKTGGQTLDFSLASGVFPSSLKGVASVDQTVNLATWAQLDGSYIQSTRVDRRTIALTLQPMRRDAWIAFKEKLPELFPPHEAVELIITHGKTVRSIEGYLNGRVELDSGGAWVNKRITLTFTCPQPYLLDETEQEIVFRQVVPLWTFPYNSMVGAGTVTGMMVTTDARYLVNGGDADIGIKAAIEAWAGAAVNPWISDGTSKVKVNVSMAVGDVVEISTVPGEKYVRLNGVNYMFFDRNSEFFSVPVGVSEISVGADEGIDNLRTNVTYRRKYSGV